VEIEPKIVGLYASIYGVVIETSGLNLNIGYWYSVAPSCRYLRLLLIWIPDIRYQYRSDTRTSNL